MTTIKSFTDLEQSKKLAEILHPESADMFYNYKVSIKNYYEDVPRVVQVSNHFTFFHHDIPCWSLASLLNVLPLATLDSSKYHHYRLRCMERSTEWYDNSIDASFEMILKLHELNLL